MLFQSTGMYLMHSVQVAYVRHEMKQRIKAGVPEEDLVVLKITKQEEQNPDIFERIHSREFRYRGEMYDIMRVKKSADTTWYTCIHDVKESKLFENLENIVAWHLSHDKQEKKRQEIMLGFFTKVYLVACVQDEHALLKKQAACFSYHDIFSEKHCPEWVEPPRFTYSA